MRNECRILVSAVFVAALVLSLSLGSRAQNREKFVISARAGGVNAVTGRATMHPHGNSEWQLLTIKEDLETGDVVRTDRDGRVEMLLNPGSYLRVGENSEFELVDGSLDNLEVSLRRGTAIVEVTGAEDNELFIGITTPHARMSIVRRGLYRVNVIPGDTTELIVRKGRVMLEDSHTKVKGGNKVVFNNGSFSVAQLSKADKNNGDGLEDWSKGRAQSLAHTNSQISSRTLDAFALSFRNDWSYSSVARRAGFWLYSSAARCYTFVPYYGGWDSPYGGGYSRSFFPGGVGYWHGRGVVVGPVGAGYGNGTTVTGRSSAGVSSGTSFPAASNAPRISDSPMTSHGKPDISPGGIGPAMRAPIKE
jgi:FecR protein